MTRLLPLLLLAACAVGAEDDAFDPTLDDAGLARVVTNVRGCGDATIAGANLADTRAVFLELPGVAADANAAGRPIRATLQLPDPAVAVSYRMGQRLTSATCVGAFPIPGPRVTADFNATGGTLEVVVTPTGGPVGMPTATIDAVLLNPTFTNPNNGVTFTVQGSLEFVGVDVGLYPP